MPVATYKLLIDIAELQAAENAIIAFVIGREAWLVSNSQGAGRARAILYSLIETAKSNLTIPHLFWLLKRLPATDERR